MPTIQDIMAKKKAFQEELVASGKEALKQEFKKTFDAHPELLAIKWRQYTPYFNDGEPCTFRVGEFEMKLATTPEDGSESDYEEEGFESTYGDGPIPEAVRTLARIDDEIYEHAFGDHCKVTATRDGFEVEEYEHD